MSNHHFTDKSKLPRPVVTGARPREISLEIIRQFARCQHVEKQLFFHDNILFLN